MGEVAICNYPVLSIPTRKDTMAAHRSRSLALAETWIMMVKVIAGR